MTSDSEKGRGEGAARKPRTRVVSEAVVAALSEEPPRLRTRVVAEALVAAIPAGGGAQAEGGTDGDEGAGA
jgi:hypothetical protein